MVYNEENRPRIGFYSQRGPGPAAWMLPPLIGRPRHALTHLINPGYSMRIKLGSIFGDGFGPGPAVYMIPKGLKANGPFLGYFQTLRGNFPIIDKRCSPGPNVYQLPIPNIYRYRGPRAVLSVRTPLIDKRVSPGPIYQLPPCIGPKIPDRNAAVECTMKGDRNIRELPRSPGPVYELPTTIGKNPAYTMRPKWKEFQDLYDASPASYVPKKCDCWKGKAPGPSFGVRYTDFTGLSLAGEGGNFDNLDCF